MFIKRRKNWDFLYCLIDKIFVHDINRKIFCAPPGNLSLKTPVLVRLITKPQIESVTVKARLVVEK